jgi:GT2 family glycosyltransferase/glycosyltransferase involved in cell wall biosynthesis
VPLASLRFPRHEEVDVSIIIPIFNQLEYTHACLASLQVVEEQTHFEVIIVDDCSTDRSAEVLPQVNGIIYLRNERNCGFVVSCNRGEEKARGKYLVFLNNDTLVKPAWLTALIETFAEQPQAGIVGSKLVYPDGRLQEAGGIIWRDASGWNYGKFDDPGDPEYNYLREVDYCSGAALMVPKALFESVGGFDSRYAPGYYEDTDLAFKVRRAGYKVLYQPLSEVIHYEGATGGTDLAAGAKKYQDVNRSTFAEAWADDLMKKPANGEVALLRQLPPGRRNILVIDHHLPMPDRDSGSLRMFQMLTLLYQLGHRVTFIPDNLADIPPYTTDLQKRGVKVVYHPYFKKVRDYLIAHGSEFDVVVLSRCQFARKHITDVRLYAPQSRIIFDTVDLHFLREQREAHLTGDPEILHKANMTKQWEEGLIDQSDETWVVSSVEQRLLREQRPDKSIQLVSNIVDAPGSNTPFALRRDWLFIGSFQHPPNVDAVLFFLKEIYPLIERPLGDAKFYIIGDKVPPEIVALATEKIIIAGLQRDVRPFFDSVRLSVAPLRFGAGVKGKINQSMAFGVPVVATSVAVEGAGLRHREEILVEDQPESFAKAVIELYQNEQLWKRISENGLKKTRALYSTDAARKKLEFLFSDAHLKGFDVSQPIAEPELVVAGDVGAGSE